MVSVSILTSDMSQLGAETKKAVQAGVHMIHLDVMDGVFVPNLTFGNVVVQSLRGVTDLPFDTHLMVNDPTRLIDLFASAGSDIITIHEESDCDIPLCLDKIGSYGIKRGISVKPNTPAERIFPYLDKVDMVLVMTVEPGEGGQGFMADMLPKIRELRSVITARSLDIDIEVDGGINDKTAPLVREAGANVLVSGSYLYNAPDMAVAIQSLCD